MIKNYTLHTFGNGEFKEVLWAKPFITDNQIEVKAQLTGICRSDVDMMINKFPVLPLGVQGHEGLGIVTNVGKNITDVEVGDFVATRADAAYSYHYNCNKNEYVKVPSLKPKYILEPVACGVNIANDTIKYINFLNFKNENILIIGSGFLSYAIACVLNQKLSGHIIDVLGAHNANVWADLQNKAKNNSFCIVRTKEQLKHKYKVIVDLTDKSDFLNQLLPNGLIVLGAEKQINTSILLWNSCVAIFPSPRNNNFYQTMLESRDLVTDNIINSGYFWSGYSRKNYKQAFADSLTRTTKTGRVYLDYRI